MPPLKPEVCVLQDRLAVFIGADYKLLPLEDADRFVRQAQGALDKLKRQERRRLRELRRAAGA
jgi:hypothetical protein